MTFNSIIVAFIVIVTVQNAFDFESMSERSCIPGLQKIYGAEVVFLSPVGYISLLQSLTPGVESCSSYSFALLLRMLQVCTCPPLLCHLHPSSYDF